jgi:hypothetical protein
MASRTTFRPHGNDLGGKLAYLPLPELSGSQVGKLAIQFKWCKRKIPGVFVTFLDVEVQLM